LGKSARAVDKAKERKVNQTVQAPCSERALKAVAIPIYPLPAISTYLEVSDRLFIHLKKNQPKDVQSTDHLSVPHTAHNESHVLKTLISVSI
jgi:hypothetical protein